MTETKDDLVHFKIDWSNTGGWDDRLIISWGNSHSGPFTVIPTSNWVTAYAYGNSPYSINTYGDFGFITDSTYHGIELCGNQIKTASEEGDDGNTNDNDGGSSTCNFEEGFDCTFFVVDGYSQITCLPIGGDGLRVGEEECDDGDVEDDQGCLSDGSGMINGWHCSGGNPTQKDSGVEQCNDGYITMSEEGEQNNYLSNDGCYECKIEVGWYGENNTELTLTTCTEICGDGLRVGTEAGDDGNAELGDGCSSTGDEIEHQCVGRGGSLTSIDVGEGCQRGWYPDSTTVPEYGVTRGNDGIRVVGEMGDDGNDNSYDGCSSEGNIENQYIGISSEPLTDSCYECLDLFKPNQESNTGEFKMYSKISLILFGLLLFILLMQTTGLLFVMCKNGRKYFYLKLNILTMPVIILHLMILLLTLQVDLNKTSKEFTILFQYILFGFEFYSISLKLDMHHSYMNVVGFSSNDIIPNIITIISVLMFLVILRAIIGILKTKGTKHYRIFKLLKVGLAILLTIFLQITYPFILIAALSILFNSDSNLNFFAFLGYCMSIIWTVLNVIMVFIMHTSTSEMRNIDEVTNTNHLDLIYNHAENLQHLTTEMLVKQNLKKIIFDCYKILKVAIFGLLCFLDSKIGTTQVITILLLIHTSEITILRYYIVYANKITRNLAFGTDLCLLCVLIIYLLLSYSSQYSSFLSFLYIFAIISTYFMQLVIVVQHLWSKHLGSKSFAKPDDVQESNITEKELNNQESDINDEDYNDDQEEDKDEIPIFS